VGKPWAVTGAAGEERAMNIVQPNVAEAVSAAAVPRDYNFAADILRRNLDAGRAGKLAYIDQCQGWNYGDLADRVERFCHVLRSLGIRREERILLCLLDSIDWPTVFLGAIKAGVVPVPSIRS
jgi:benzoate-CoA ligase